MLDTKWRVVLVTMVAIGLQAGTVLAQDDDAGAAGAAAGAAAAAAGAAAAGGGGAGDSASAPASDQTTDSAGGDAGPGFQPIPKDEAPRTLEQLASEPADENEATELVSDDGKAQLNPDVGTLDKLEYYEKKRDRLAAILKLANKEPGAEQVSEEYMDTLADWAVRFQENFRSKRHLLGHSEEEANKILKEAYGKVLKDASVGVAEDIVGRTPPQVAVAMMVGKALVGGMWEAAGEANTALQMDKQREKNYLFYSYVRGVAERDMLTLPGDRGDKNYIERSLDRPVKWDRERGPVLEAFYANNRTLIEKVTGDPGPLPDRSGKFASPTSVKQYLDRHAAVIYAHLGVLNERTARTGFPLGIDGNNDGKTLPFYYKRVTFPRLKDQLKDATRGAELTRAATPY